jgi:inosose dehydratase
MTVRFGVSPIAWINDDMPELGGDTPVETIFRDAHAIGFAGVELGGKFPREAAALKTLLDPHSLDLIGGWWSTRLLARPPEAEIFALQAHLALLKAMGSRVFIAAECSNAIHGDRTHPLRGSPRLRDEEWALFGHRLTAVADYVGGHGFTFAYHFHLGTTVERPEDIDALVQHTADNVGFVVDTGHAALGGIDAAGLIRKHPARVAHVHAKDVRRRIYERIRDSGQSFLDGVLAGMFTVPGDGDLDFAPIVGALAEIGYCGWIVVEAEQDPALADPRKYSQVGFDTLQRQAAAAGLTTAAE